MVKHGNKEERHIAFQEDACQAAVEVEEEKDAEEEEKEEIYEKEGKVVKKLFFKKLESGKAAKSLQETQGTARRQSSTSAYGLCPAASLRQSCRTG